MIEFEMVNAHYGHGDILARIDSGLAAAGKNLSNLTVDDLAPIDAFHTRGRVRTMRCLMSDADSVGRRGIWQRCMAVMSRALT